MWYEVVYKPRCWLLNLLQVVIKDNAGQLARQWARLAETLANKPDAYQLVLQEGSAPTATATATGFALAAAPSKTLLALDAELLLRARRCMSASQPAAACEALLLLMERSLMKEQLAAGLLQQEGAGIGSSGSNRVSSSGVAGRDRSSSVDGQAAGAAAAELEPWAKVRPLPPGGCHSAECWGQRQDGFMGGRQHAC